jgi:thiaminase/transcriptional activator TenA
MQDFAAWAEARQDARFTDWLRADVAAVWEQAADHRFARELAAGSIDDAVFRRYLIQDYSFIDVFCTLLGFAVGHAPSLQDRIPLAQFLGLVTSEENTYFERALAAVGVEFGAVAVELAAQPTDEFGKAGIGVQLDPLGVDEARRPSVRYP